MIRFSVSIYILIFLLQTNIVFAAVNQTIVNALEDAGGYMDELTLYSEEISQKTETINNAKNGVMGPIQAGRKYLETAMEYQQKATSAIQDAQEYVDEAKGLAQKVQGYANDTKSISQSIAGGAQSLSSNDTNNTPTDNNEPIAVNLSDRSSKITSASVNEVSTTHAINQPAKVNNVIKTSGEGANILQPTAKSVSITQGGNIAPAELSESNSPIVSNVSQVALDKDKVVDTDTPLVPEMVAMVNAAIKLQSDVANYCLEDRKSEECIQARAKLQQSIEQQDDKPAENVTKDKIIDKVKSVSNVENLSIGSIEKETAIPQISDSAATEAINKVIQMKKEIFTDREISAPKVRSSFTKEIVVKETADE